MSACPGIHIISSSSSRSLDNTGGVLSPSDAPTWSDPEKFWLSLCFQSSGVHVQAVKAQDSASHSEGLSVSFQGGCHFCTWCFSTLCWHCSQLQRSAAPWWRWGRASGFLERFSLCCFPIQHLSRPGGLPKAAAMFMSGFYDGCHDPTVTYAKLRAWRKQEHPAWEK